MTDRELLQQALDALEDCLDDNVGWYDGALYLQRAIRAHLAQPELKNQCGETCERAKLCAICAQGIAQPEQDLVTIETIYETVIQWDDGGGKRSRRELARRIAALYISPPQRQPLTDEHIERIGKAMPYADRFDFARAIEAAHNIKETK